MGGPRPATIESTTGILSKMSLIRRMFSLAAVSTLLVGVAVAQPQALPTSNAQQAGAKPDTPTVPVPPPPTFDARSWVLMDAATGRVLTSKDPDKREIPASLTKIMNAYVVGAEIAQGKVSMQDKVLISTHAWKEGGAGTDGSTSFLKVHSRVPLIDLLKGMLVQSGNDAAIALAEHVGGSEQGFVSLMNAYARQIDLTGTHYSDASGYPVKDHYSTARDTAELTRALIHRFPRIYAIASIKHFTWNGIKQANRNLLLWRDPSVDGVKTGHTKGAGYCLDASAKRGNLRLIAVVMGAPSEQARADDAQTLLNYGFRAYENHTLYQAGKTLASPRLWKGQDGQLPVGVSRDVIVTVKRGEYDQLKASMDLPATLVAPYRQGQKVGTLNITLNGKSLLSRPLIALKDAPQGGFFSRMWDAIALWFHHLFGSGK